MNPEPPSPKENSASPITEASGISPNASMQHTHKKVRFDLADEEPNAVQDLEDLVGGPEVQRPNRPKVYEESKEQSEE